MKKKMFFFKWLIHICYILIGHLHEYQSKDGRTILYLGRGVKLSDEPMMTGDHSDTQKEM